MKTAWLHVDMDGLDAIYAAQGSAFTGSRDDFYTTAVDNSLSFFDRHGVKATYFLIARDLDIPDKLAGIRKLVAEGHRIASHSYSHPSLLHLNGESLRREIVDSKAKIEDTLGVACKGFRAPGYGDDERLHRVLTRYDYMIPWITNYPLLEQFYESLSPPRRHLFLTVEGQIQRLVHLVHQSLSYTTVGSAFSALLRRGSDARIVDGAACAEKDADLISNLLTRGSTCSKADLRWAFRNDGSYDERYQSWKPLTLNENDADAVSLYLKPGDEVTIAGLMDRICKLVTSQGRKCVFLIPPVYETPRTSGADTIVTKALALVPHMPVIDDRPARDRNYFHDYDHPNSLYFDRLVSILRERGFVAKAAP